MLIFLVKTKKICKHETEMVGKGETKKGYTLPISALW